jgi:hypothetical protein
VQNWFQNRRAKAKQQKKQEEFETKRTLGFAEGWKSESSLPSGCSLPLHLSTAATSANSDANQLQVTTSSAKAVSDRNSAENAGWASLPRALPAAPAAQNQRAREQEQEQGSTSMPPPLMPPSDHPVVTQTTSYSDWNLSAATPAWPLSQAEDSLSFDFGFGQPDHPYSSDASQSQDSPEATSVPGFAVSADVWSTAAHTPTAPSHPSGQTVDHGSTTFTPAQPIDISQSATFSPPQLDTTFQLPQYPASRRGSASDELTSNFGNFALVGTPPVPSPLRTASDLESFRRNEGEIDLAARRKRPRPAALGSAALRSRSYGAPPSMSPTFRFGNQSPHHHSIRQVKSMGQNLNVRYSGIRKPSSAQRSPLNVASFAEADSLREILQAQQTNAERNAETTPPTPISSEDLIGHPFPVHGEPLFSDQDQHTPHQFYFNGQYVNFNMASPPSTPLKPEFYPANLQATVLPLSAPPQYAVFPDHTPPYSAGPLTNSSWSDAQFTLTEMPYSLPHVVYPTAQDFSNGVFQNSSAPAQPKADTACASDTDQKQTEFLIHEFPRQKEEHAHAAQQLAQQKPKNYVFANATPNDF